MKCPECEKIGNKSKVFIDSSQVTAMGASHYYDEEGKYHIHDPNTRKTRYTCSRRHSWIVKKRNSCWCGE
jgi:hypothetical protein